VDLRNMRIIFVQRI
jgi:TonB dependent receptor.